MLHLIVPSCCNRDIFSGFVKSLLDHVVPCSVCFSLNTDDGAALWEALGWMERLKSAGFGVEAFYAPEKIGYVWAMEKAWRLIQPEPSDLVATLNDDVIVEGDVMGPLEAAVRSCGGQAGASVQWVGLDGFWGVGDGRERYKYAEGWCWMARAETIQRAGGIVDLNFAPTFCEDSDLSVRIQDIGESITRVQVPVRHLAHQTIHNSQEKMAYWSRNCEYLAKKHRLGT